jgi:hypothetical protein
MQVRGLRGRAPHPLLPHEGQGIAWHQGHAEGEVQFPRPQAVHRIPVRVQVQAVQGRERRDDEEVPRQKEDAEVCGTDDEPYWLTERDIAYERCGNDCDCRRSDPPDTWCYKHDDWREEAEHE